jgi:hypothetical protein
VVLFDEVEKAHEDVFNILLQVLDDGRLTDGQGRTVDFRNCIIVLTSNLGAQAIAELPDQVDVEQARPAVMRAVRDRFRPEFLNRLDEVVLMDAEGREALRLPAVQAALSVRSLWRLGFDQLVIDGPVLDIRRTTDGRLLLAGIPLEPDDDRGSGGMLDWFFDQTEFAIRGGTLRWTDDQRPDAVPLELNGIAMVFRNQGRQHQFRLDASPPPDWGQPFTLQGQFSRPVWQTRAGDPVQSSAGKRGTTYSANSAITAGWIACASGSWRAARSAVALMRP